MEMLKNNDKRVMDSPVTRLFLVEYATRGFVRRRQ
jgi:hypothetical protein